MLFFWIWKTAKKSSEINWPLPSSAQHQTAPKEKFHKLTNAEELGFDIGQKLMILIRKREFHPCTVIKLIDHFLTLKIDTLDGKEYICSAQDPIIFPLSWPQTQGLKFFIRLDLICLLNSFLLKFWWAWVNYIGIKSFEPPWPF